MLVAFFSGTYMSENPDRLSPLSRSVCSSPSKFCVTAEEEEDGTNDDQTNADDRRPGKMVCLVARDLNNAEVCNFLSCKKIDARVNGSEHAENKNKYACFFHLCIG